jgi:hypothetical protein
MQRAKKATWINEAALLLLFCPVIFFSGCVTGQSVDQPSSPTEIDTTAPIVLTLTSTGLPTATPLPTITPGSTAEPDLIVVDAAQNLGNISPLVYGSNVGPWQSITKADVELINYAGFTIFRYPGGSYVDENAPSQSALDEFILLCRQVNAEPMVQVKLVNSTPKAAADMVKYANITKGYGIKYWSIGNEPSLYWGQRNIPHYDTVAFNTEWREFALAMKAVDPSILLLGPEIHQYTGTPGDAVVDIHFKDWMKEFLLANGDLVDIISFHRYPFGNFDPFSDELLRSSEEWDKIIPNLRQLILATTGRDIPIAVTEVNSNWSNRSGKETTPDTLLNAIWWADALGRMINQDVEIVNQFAVDGNGGWALLGPGTPRYSYYVYLIYKDFGSQRIFSSSGIQGITSYAAIREDGSLSLILVNRKTSQTTISIDLRNFDYASPAKQILLDATYLAEEISPILINDNFSTDLPALSITLLVIPSGK